jgi:hypothetical protein
MQQLLRFHLFPATTEQPTTAFTFVVLREYHVHSLESKKSGYSYMRALCRLTDNTFTSDVPVRDTFFRLLLYSLTAIVEPISAVPSH